MKLIWSAVLYTALALGANAGGIDSLRVGDMKKLMFHGEARAVSEAAFTDVDGAERTLGDWQGQWVLLNFWATWCAPCRHEMPALDALEREFGGEDFAVVTVATGRNPLPAVRRFFDEAGVTDLPLLFDADRSLSREMAAFGLPVTVLIDPEGREVARMVGAADWASEEALALIGAIVDGGV